MNNKKIPVLLIAFSRPNETRGVLQRIGEYYPDDLYVFIDYSDNHTEAIDDVKRLIDEDVWASKIHTNYQKNSLGCGKGPSTAIDWIFSQEEMAIILEDDCVPGEDFFRFMEKGLKEKEADRSCFMLSGNKYSLSKKTCFKTRFSFTHGWATWKRAWDGYDYTIGSWGDNRSGDLDFIPYYVLRGRWSKIFDKVFNDDKKTYWDYQWQYHIWINNGYSLQPPVNLIDNIGFNENGTHTLDEDDWRNKVQSVGYNRYFSMSDSKYSILNEIQGILIQTGVVSAVYRFFKFN